MRGGHRPNAGRKKGTKNTATVERQRAVAEMTVKLEATLPNVFKGNAHELLMAVYKNEDLPLPTRIDAAKAAIPHETPKLSSVEHKGDPDNPLEQNSRVELVVIDAGDSQGIRPSQAGAITQTRPI